jgi:hypothetical protein
VGMVMGRKLVKYSGLGMGIGCGLAYHNANVKFSQIGQKKKEINEE